MGFLSSADIEFVFASSMESTSIEATDVRMSSLSNKGNQHEVVYVFLDLSHLALHNNSQNLSAVVASPGNRQASPMTAIESILSLVTSARCVGGIVLCQGVLDS